jgi:CheY-like chemotaxis protein
MTSDVRPKRLLIVDDDDDLREGLAEFLEDEGYEVASAGSGAEALAFLGQCQTSWLVVLDLDMGDMNGYEVIGALDKHRDRFPILVVSGAPLTAMPPGLRYVRKPFKREDLIAAIAELAAARS